MEVNLKEQLKAIILESDKELQGRKKIPMKVEDDNEMVSLIKTCNSIEDEECKSDKVIDECAKKVNFSLSESENDEQINMEVESEKEQ